MNNQTILNFKIICNIKIKSSLLLLSIVLLTYACEKNCLQDSSDSSLIMKASIDNFDISYFSSSDEFCNYLEFLDDFVPSNAYALLHNVNCDSTVFIQEDLIFSNIGNTFPVWQNLSVQEQYVVLDSAIKLTCFGMKKAEKRLEAFIREQHRCWANRLLTEQQCKENIQTAVEEFNRRYHRNYPEDRMGPQ